MRGGRREGSGRKLGGVNKKTREIADAAAAQGITPIEVLLSSMRAAWARSKDGTIQGEDLMLAISCAERSAPYIHPRVQAISLDSNVDTKVTGNLVVTWGGVRPPEPETAGEGEE